MKRNLYLLGSLALATLTPLSLHAQTTEKKDTTMNRTVVVEQEYTPDILDAAKVNILPKVEVPSVSKKAVEYATTFFPTTTIPAGLMHPYTGVETQPNWEPGYVRAGYGNYGNLDVLANYLFRLSSKDKLNVCFQMDGMDGELTLPDEQGKWDAFYYRTRANVDYTHQFSTMDLNVGGNFGLSNFNYRPDCAISKQKFTSGDIHTGVKFTDETAPLQFDAATSLLMYNRQNNFVENTYYSAFKETIWRINGHVNGAINDEQHVTLAMTMNNFWYTGQTADAQTGQQKFKNHASLDLSPYYEFNGDDWKLHAGANVDFSFGFDKTLRVSPDITAQYTFSDSYVLYAKATGGKIINDFRRLEEVNPYSEVLPLDDTYEQINAGIGFKASPYPGVWLHTFGGYQNLKNDLLYVFLSYPAATGYKYANNFDQANTNNTYIGANISYDYKDYLSLAAKYIYRGWNSKEEFEYMLIIKPESELTFNVNAHPISALNINLGYDYVSRKSVKGVHMSAISNLHVGASYNFFKGVSAYARLNNLLNKEYQQYIGYPTEGFNFLGGLSFSF